MKQFRVGLLALILLAGCAPQFDIPEVDSGEADFSSYVAVGSSFTSGFADGALSRQGQLSSFPNLLAARMQEAGGGPFHIPLLKGDRGTYPDYDLTRPERYTLTLPRLVLVKEPDCRGEIGLTPKRLEGLGDNEINLDDPSQRIGGANTVFHLLGVPAMRAIDFILPGYGDVSSYLNHLPFSPYYWRFATDPQSSTVMQEMIKAMPTFFTMEFGTGDLLAYATKGGTGHVNGSNAKDLISPSAFQTVVSMVLDTLVNRGAKGVVTNVPDITVFPFFTTIDYDALDLDASEAQDLNDLWAGTGMVFQPGNNPFVIEEDGQVRQIKPGEKILLSVSIDSLKCYGLGDSIPIPDRFVLSENEINVLRQYSLQYNQIIGEEAAKRNIPVVDLRSFFEKLANVYTLSGIDFSTEFVSGAFFSLDGLHPTPVGQAALANLFIDVINRHYGASLQRYQLSDFPGVVFP